MEKYSDSIRINWYLSYEILSFERDDADVETRHKAWENIVLIKATSPQEAYDKAIVHGKQSEEQVLIDGEKGYCRFNGIRKLVPIYEEPLDGAELEWFEFESSTDDLRKMIPPRQDLQAFQPLTQFEEDAGSA